MPTSIATTTTIHVLLISLAALVLAGCETQAVTPTPPPAPPTPPAADTEPDLAVRWVRDAAEYRALARQAYTSAAKDLDGMVDDPYWSALPEQTDAVGLRPAIIFDVDETLVTNVMFQVGLTPPFRNSKLDDWNAANKAVAVPGAPEFVQLARDSGVTVFFVTNRPCEAKEANPCPQKAVTIEDLNEAGIPADATNVLMANERPEWTGEKKVRRDLIAQEFRVIMLIGDDLGDFIPCIRARPVAPCTEPATKASRQQETERHRAYWGNGWYILPNPMHGSWTSAR